MKQLTIRRAIPYFSEDELRCKGSGIIMLDYRFAERVVELREVWGRPMHPISVCRSPEHNEGVGGHPRSLHLTINPFHPTHGTMAMKDMEWRHGTMAMDVKWRWWLRSKMLRFCRLAWSLGWSIGLHDGFCHIDRRADLGLPQRVFIYGTWSAPFSASDITNNNPV
jgi:hypothetical protein